MDDSDESDYDDPQAATDAAMAAYLPAQFGKTSKEANIAAQFEQSRRRIEQDKPAQVKDTPGIQTSKSDSDDGSDDSDDDSADSDDDDDEYPTSHELVLKTHEKAVTSVSLDPAGARLVTSSMDGTVKLHDFASMTPTTLRAFKSIDPWEKKASASTESFAINHVQFSPLVGGMFMSISSHPQAKILSRDGEILTEFVKGDMYLRDMHNTKGHVSEVTTGTWHPTDRNTCVTAGTDSTLRIWDVNNKRSQKEVIVVKSRTAGSAGRTRLTAVAWGASPSGGAPLLVAAALDGTLVMYSGDGPHTRPAGEIREAHTVNTWTSGIDISSDGRMVVTRGGDGLIKLWDMRKFKEPLVKVEHASTADRFPMSNIRYSPNSTNIITGSATGHLHILNPGNLQPEHVTPITPGVPLIAVEWHPKLNQIITGSANAETHVLFSPIKSTRGAVEVMSRAPKKRHIDDNPSLTMDTTIGIHSEGIITPGAMPATRKPRGGAPAGVTGTGRPKDPRRPHVPQVTPFQRSQPDEKSIAENIPLATMLHENPRDALLKYADKAKQDPVFTKAWKDTQPVTEYADDSGEDEAPQRKKAKPS